MAARQAAAPATPPEWPGPRRRALGSTSRCQDTHLAHLCHVLVAASTDAEQHRLIMGPSAVLRRNPAHRVRRLERRDDSLELAQQPEAGERFVVRDGDILRAARVLEVGVLRTDAGII